MKKMLQAAAVSAALIFATVGASAATTIGLTGSGNSYTGSFTVTHSADFTDEYIFTPTFPSTLVTASLITIGITASENIDFTSVWLNGIELTKTSGAAGLETAYTAAPTALTGPITLTVNGKSGDNATYSGTFNLTVVPEPESYALMLAGLGVVGYISRRKRKANLTA